MSEAERVRQFLKVTPVVSGNQDIPVTFVSASVPHGLERGGRGKTKGSGFLSDTVSSPHPCPVACGLEQPA